MACIFELACVVIGIIVLVYGRVPMGAGREVRGIPAYFVGGLFVATQPLAGGVAFTIGYLEALQGGHGQLEQFAAAIEYVIIFACVIAALIVALVNAKPKRRKSRRRIVDEDYGHYDHRPRKRRDEIEDDEDDRPRRSRRYDDDDYDRPRRDF